MKNYHQKGLSLKIKFDSTMRNNSGFTLIEVLVVIAIIALLSSLIFTMLTGAKAKARDARRVGDINQFAKALEMYFLESFTYPTNSVNAAQMTTANFTIAGLVPKYLKIVPSSPTPADGGCVDGTARGQNNYFYDVNIAGGIGTTYTITFCLGKKTGDVLPGIRSLTPKGVQ